MSGSIMAAASGGGICFRASVSRQVRNPVRAPVWNGSIRAGDGLKFALSVYADDNANAAIVDNCQALLALWPEQSHAAVSCDYGLSWFTGGSPIPYAGGMPVAQASGFATPVRPGGINFYLPASITQGLYGRYRLAVMVDLPDGSFSMLEGVLQIRAQWFVAAPLLAHTQGVLFSLDVSALDSALLAALVVNGVPCDADGFPLLIGGSVDGVSAAALAQIIATLPTVLPASAGQLWLNSGVLSVS